MAAPPVTRQRPDRALIYAALVIVAGVLATTLAQTQVLARLPLQNLLKNELHADRTANAAFFFWAGLAWYLKPFAGILTDAFPLFGSRRKSYILISATLAALSWLVLIVTPHEYRALLLVVIVINTFMMVTSTVVGGYMVETAQASSGSGRLTALRQFVQQGCWIVNGPAAGYLASIAFGWTAAACGGVMFLLVPVTVLFLREQRQRSDPRLLLQNARYQLVKIATARTMWGAAGLMALFYIAPGFATALFYKQQNELHLGTQAQGFLQLIAGVCGVRGRCRLRHPVPAPQSPHLAGRVHGLSDGGQFRLSVLQLGGPRAGDRRIERLRLHLGRAGADGSCRARDTGRQRGVGLLVDGQRPQSGALRDRLVRLAFARRISFFF